MHRAGRIQQGLRKHAKSKREVLLDRRDLIAQNKPFETVNTSLHDGLNTHLRKQLIHLTAHAILVRTFLAVVSVT